MQHQIYIVLRKYKFGHKIIANDRLLTMEIMNCGTKDYLVKLEKIVFLELNINNPQK